MNFKHVGHVISTHSFLFLFYCNATFFILLQNSLLAEVILCNRLYNKPDFFAYDTTHKIWKYWIFEVDIETAIII